MKYKLLVLLLIFTSCAPSLSTKNNIPYNSKGFAYIYNESDYISKIIKIKMNTNKMQIAHNRLRPGTLIKVINPKTNDSIILKNYKKTTYPSFYKILITDAVANKIEALVCSKLKVRMLNEELSFK